MLYRTHLSLAVSVFSEAISTRSFRFSCSKNAALIAIWSSLARLASRDLFAASLFFLLCSQYISSFCSSGNDLGLRLPPAVSDGGEGK